MRTEHADVLEANEWDTTVDPFPWSLIVNLWFGTASLRCLGSVSIIKGRLTYHADHGTFSPDDLLLFKRSLDDIFAACLQVLLQGRIQDADRDAPCALCTHGYSKGVRSRSEPSPSLSTLYWGRCGEPVSRWGRCGSVSCYPHWTAERMHATMVRVAHRMNVALVSLVIVTCIQFWLIDITALPIVVVTCGGTRHPTAHCADYRFDGWADPSRTHDCPGRGVDLGWRWRPRPSRWCKCIVLMIFNIIFDRRGAPM